MWTIISRVTELKIFHNSLSIKGHIILSTSKLWGPKAAQEQYCLNSLRYFSKEAAKLGSYSLTRASLCLVFWTLALFNLRNWQPLCVVCSGFQYQIIQDVHQIEYGKQEAPLNLAQNVTHPDRRVGHYLLNSCDEVTMLLSALLVLSPHLILPTTPDRGTVIPRN